MSRQHYQSINDWWGCVKSDWNKSWERDSFINSPLELRVIQLANFLLLTFLFYRLATLASPYIGFIKDKNILAASLVFVWEGVIKCLNHLGFSVAKRFNVFEVFKFNLSSSYYIFLSFFILNILSIIPCKLLADNKYARGK